MEEEQIVGVVNYSDVCSLTNLRQQEGKCLSKEYWGMFTSKWHCPILVMVIVDLESEVCSMWRVYGQVVKGRFKIECYCPIVRNEKVQEPEKLGSTIQLVLSESLLLFLLVVPLVTSL
ncbi:MAG: hypothetical protein EZS28_056391, partial [Streblomastix strix]